jgi:hypothetical protein
VTVRTPEELHGGFLDSSGQYCENSSRPPVRLIVDTALNLEELEALLVYARQHLVVPPGASSVRTTSAAEETPADDDAARPTAQVFAFDRSRDRARATTSGSRAVMRLVLVLLAIAVAVYLWR